MDLSLSLSLYLDKTQTQTEIQYEEVNKERLKRLQRCTEM
jgi:hypothetical protein